MKKLAFILFNLVFAISFSQTTTQTIRGKIVDKESRYPIIGAGVVVVSDSSKSLVAVTNLDGDYRIDGVEVGRHTIKVSFIGYYDKVVPVVVNSGKELILNLDLEETTLEMKEVTVTADANGGVKNEMALVSVTSFSVEETDKYAGSRGDPARMASNFAGVSGSDDSRNDIVVRGNSPLGILWRVEGIDIPNPNHFAISGTSGGPVSILNNKLMANSDFFTGAFPAEYGNSVAGVFDLKLRNGNNEKHEFSGQLGFLGTELMGEGPISKKSGSSYLFAYRYSTLSLFGGLGVPIGTSAIPNYQDLSFKLNFPQKNGGALSLFAISGVSNIDIVLSTQKKPEIETFGEQDRDQYFRTKMAIAGLTYVKPLNENTFFKTTIAGAIDNQKSTHNYFLRSIVNNEYQLDTLYKILDYSFTQTKLSISSFINRKMGKRDVLKYGFNADMYVWNQQDSVYDDQFSNSWIRRWDNESNGFLIQPYLQWKHKFSETFAVNFGLHSQILTFNNSISPIEPRVGLKWNIDEKQVFTAGAGLHSQMQPTYTYFYQQSNGQGGFVQHNREMDFTKSMHYVIGYSTIIKGLFIKSEVYYQSLFNIPVEIQPSAFSMVNQGSGFARFFPDTLTNKGTGSNYGLELTLKKNIGKGFFVMITGALYESKYKGSDNIERNTDYNGNFASNLLFGKEFKVGNKSTMNIGGKVTWAGGRRLGYVDTAASAAAREVIFLDSAYNELQFRDYFRADIKLNYVINNKRVTHEIGLDLVNFLGIKNLLNLTYAPTPDDPTRIVENTQLGFLPIFYYRIDF